MNGIFYRAIVKHQQKNEEIKEYFEVCMDSINEGNLFMLRRSCMYISVIYLLMLLIGLLFMPEFRITTVHILMLPLMIIQYRINVFIMNKSPISTNATGIVCCSFYFWLALIFIAIDTVVYADKQAYFVPMLILVFPVLYIDKMYKYGWEEFVIAVIFAVFSYKFKDFLLFKRDIYMILGAYSVAMVLGHLILEMRSREALAMKELKGESSLDKLTHVFNKGALLQKINGYFFQKSEDESCAMIIMDIDDFKNVNDNLGHNTGDILLEKVGQILIDSFRAYDVTGRYGGDEFVVLMPQMSDANILQMRCRALQKLLGNNNVGNKEPITMSIGAIISKMRDSNEVFRMADDALYKSKIAGKNICTIWNVEKQEFDKTILLCVSDGSMEAVRRLQKEKGADYEIISAASDNDALKTTSQYHKQMKLVLVEVSEKSDFGELTLRYMKKREAFKNIPILALVKTDAEERLAKELGADEVVKFDSLDEKFLDSVNNLVGM